MNKPSEKLFLYNDLTERILDIRDQLTAPQTDRVLDSLSLSLFDLGSITEELKIANFPEICEDLRQILAMILSGKRTYNDLVKESIQLFAGLIYRSAVNNEPCLAEIEDLTLLVQGIKQGDTDGFHVTDHKMPLSDDAQVSLFNDDDSAVLFDDDDSAVLFDDSNEEQPQLQPDPKSEVMVLKLKPSKPLNMLIVDDDFNSRFLMRHILENFGAYDFATDGAEAVQAFQLAHECDQPYDVVFMDISMPVMDGQQALQEIRAFEREHGVKEAIIFMVTCLTAYDTVCQAFFKGYCTDYISKPIKTNQIIHKMQEYKLLN